MVGQALRAVLAAEHPHGMAERAAQELMGKEVMAALLQDTHPHTLLLVVAVLEQ
jgi:hypothetical protein